MAYDDDDGDVMDIDEAAGLGKAPDEMDGFHDVDPLTGIPVVADVVEEDDDEDEDDDPDEDLTEVNL